MAKRGLNAAQYCDLLGEIIKRLGPKAYRHAGLIILYSGPNSDIQKLLAPIFGARSNWHISRDQSIRTSGVRIDETVVGRNLETRDLDAYFAASFGGDPDLIRSAKYDVWAFVSEQFVSAAFRHAATAVCGADETRVFRRHELRIAIYNPAAETINGIAIAHVQEAFRRGGEYAAFRKICQAELALARQWVRDAKPGAEKAAAWREYRARRKFFIMERQQTIRGAIAPPHRAISSLSGIHTSLLRDEISPLPATRMVSHPKAAGSHPH